LHALNRCRRVPLPLRQPWRTLSAMRALATMLLCSTVAHAEHETGHGFVAPQLGVGAPLGVLGVEAGIGFDWFRGAVGAGFGTGGTQVAAMARAMMATRWLELGIGLGVSHGAGPVPIAFDQGDEDDHIPRFSNDTFWANAELVVEVALSRRTLARFFIGVSYAIGDTCEDRDGPCDGLQRTMLENDRWMPYTGVAAVFRFPERPAHEP
jgi:hypothetical protein